jgi:hypothetical protein
VRRALAVFLWHVVCLFASVCSLSCFFLSHEQSADFVVQLGEGTWTPLLAGPRLRANFGHEA